MDSASITRGAFNSMSAAIVKINSVDVSNHVESWEINRPDGWAISSTINFSDLTYFDECDPQTDYGTLKISITVGSDKILFLIDERKESIDDKSAKFSIWCRSKHAWLGEKHAGTISDLSQSNPWEGAECTYAEAIAGAIAYAAGTVGVTLSIPDYDILTGALSVENEYPIDVIKRLADAAGAEIIAHINGTLELIPYVNGPTLGTSIETFSEINDIILLSSGTTDINGHDAVMIYGYSTEEITPSNSLIAKMVEPGPYYVSTLGRYIYKARVYMYQSGTAVIPLLFTDNLNLNYIWGSISTETITETVRLAWGRGTRSKPNLEGVTQVVGNTALPFEYVSDTYDVRFVDAYVQCAFPETVDINFYLADNSADTQLSIDFELLPDDVTTGKPFMSAVIISDPPFYADEDIVIRLYWWHDLYNPGDLVYASLDSVASIELSSTASESITEFVRLVFGRGNTSMPDTNGNTEVSSPSHFPSILSTLEETYVTGYTDFNTNNDAGDYEFYFGFPDKSASATLSLSIQPVPDPDPEPEVIDYDIIIRDHYSKVSIAGASVTLDGVSQGTTDVDGVLTLSSVTRGQTYDIFITKSGYADSDDDLIANDSITIPEA